MSSLYQPRRRRSSLRQFQILGILGVIVYVVAQFVVFQLSLARVPDTWTIGGAAYPDEPIEVAVDHVREDLQLPVTLRYFDQAVQLDPASIEFSVDITETLRLVREARSQSSALGDFLRRLIFQPPASREVPVVVNYSDERVRAQLAAVAAQYDQAPRPPQPITATMTLADAQPGRRLNIVQSMPAIDAALKSVAAREVDLIIDELPAPASTLNLLGQLFEARLTSFPGEAGVFLKDLRTGQELNLNADAVYAGAGQLKLSIVLEALRRSDLPLDAAMAQRIVAAVQAEELTQPANDLLAALGGGDAAAATSNVTALAHNLGLSNTFIARPFDQPITATQPISISAPADAVEAAQTTPVEMGLMLEMIAQCRTGGGVLLVVYPDQFSAEKCELLVDLLRQYPPVDVPALLLGGLPAGTEAVHRPGGSADTRADAALVYTPGGDYVLAVFLSISDQSLDWNAANTVMVDLAQAAYKYFNP